MLHLVPSWYLSYPRHQPMLTHQERTAYKQQDDSKHEPDQWISPWILIDNLSASSQFGTATK